MFLDIGLINGCFNVSAPIPQKMVLVAMASNSVDGIYQYTSDLTATVGCSRNTLYKSIKGLLDAGVLRKVGRGTYELVVVPVLSWLNLDHFKRCMDLALPYNKKLVLLAIVKHIKKGTSQCWPKVSTLQELVGASERTVRRLVGSLTAAGIIDRLKQGRVWVFSTIYGTPKTDISDKLVPDMPVVVPDMTGRNNYLNKKEYKEEQRQALLGVNLFKNIIIGSVVKMAGVRDKIKKMAEETKKPKNYKNNVTGLVDLWKGTLPLVSMSNIIAVKITNKDRGMLKHFKSFVEAQEGASPIEVLEHILVDWSDVSVYLKEHTEAYHVPTDPSIPLITKYVMPLYQWHCGSKSKPLSEAPETTIKPVNHEQPKPKVSLDELLYKYCD